MKVAYVSTLERGGPVSHLLTLAPAVAAAGADVEVVCASEDVANRFRALGVPARAAPIGHKADLRGGAALRPLLRGADVVHTHDRRAGLFGRPAGRANGARVVHTLHGVPDELVPLLGRPGAAPAPGTSRARLLLSRHAVLRAEAMLARLGTVVVPSSAMAAFLEAHGFPGRRVRVVPHGIHPAPAARKPVHDTPFVVGTAAGLEHWKGIDVLLEAAALAQVPVRLEIFGDGSRRGELERMAAALRIDACFHGFVEDLSTRLAGLHAFALPSRGENLPLAIMEAMAAGVPVIATRAGGIPELVVDGETGRLVEVDDPQALAGAVDELAGDPGKRRSLGSLGRQRIEEKFSAAGAARRMVDLYEDVCASST